MYDAIYMYLYMHRFSRLTHAMKQNIQDKVHLSWKMNKKYRFENKIIKHVVRYLLDQKQTKR
jgi:hypothetical protein